MESRIYHLRANYERRTATIYQALLVAKYALDSVDDGKASKELSKVVTEFKDFTQYDGTTPFGYYVSILFVQIISEAELHLIDLLKLIIGAHPSKLGARPLKLIDVIQAETKEDIIDQAISAYLNDLMYKKPADYIKDISDLLSFDKSLIEDDWKVYIEAKARRDLGIHNNWLANPVYLKKAAEAGVDVSSMKLGVSLAPDRKYLVHAMNATDNLIEKLSEHCVGKFGKAN